MLLLELLVLEQTRKCAASIVLISWDPNADSDSKEERYDNEKTELGWEWLGVFWTQETVAERLDFAAQDCVLFIDS